MLLNDRVNQKHMNLLSYTTVFLAASSTPSANANSTYTSGLTTNSSMFTRINGATNYYYEAIRVIVYISGTYNFISSSNLNTYGYLYVNNFNTSNLNLNLVAQDDDNGGNLQFRFTAFLQPNVTYILVVTTYSPGVTGSFSIIASGALTVSLNRTSTTIVTTTPMITVPTSEYIRLLA